MKKEMYKINNIKLLESEDNKKYKTLLIILRIYIRKTINTYASLVPTSKNNSTENIYYAYIISFKHCISYIPHCSISSNTNHDSPCSTSYNNGALRFVFKLLNSMMIREITRIQLCTTMMN